MDGKCYGTQIEAVKRELADLRRQMDGPYQSWLSSACEAFVAWYEIAMKEAVKQQYEHAGKLGLTGMLALKQQFVAFLQATRSSVRDRLSGASSWSHMHDIGEMPRALAREDAYSNESRFSGLIGPRMAPIFARLVVFLRDNGFSIPKEVCESENPKTNSREVKAICSTPKAIAAIATYANLHAELIHKTRHLAALEDQWADAIVREKQRQDEQRVEQAKNGALELWNSAFSLAFGQDIDWDDAWEKADELWRAYDDWDDKYEEWLRATRAGEDANAFDVFLASTNNVNKFECHIRKIWKNGLIKALEKQWVKARFSLLLDLIDEQVSKRVVANEYESYAHVLEYYTDHTCHECFAFCEYTCSCNRCDECCKCPGRSDDRAVT